MRIGQIVDAAEHLHAAEPVAQARVAEGVGRQTGKGLGAEIVAVGARADGNDLGPEAFPRLPAYTFCDASLRYRFGRVEVFGGINNLSDAHYSTIAYSSTLYPMAERNAFAGVRLEL